MEVIGEVYLSSQKSPDYPLYRTLEAPKACLDVVAKINSPPWLVTLLIELF
jgi:hypothetical protein